MISRTHNKTKENNMMVKKVTLSASTTLLYAFCATVGCASKRLMNNTMSDTEMFPYHNLRGSIQHRMVAGTWDHYPRLLPDIRIPLATFGLSVSLYENTALIGAPSYDDSNGLFSGSAYIFDYMKLMVGS